MPEKRTAELLDAVRAMAEGQFRVHVPSDGEDGLGELGLLLRELGESVETSLETGRKLSGVVEKVNAGVKLEEVLNYAYESFKELIPYDRIGFALLDEQGRVVARWARSEAPELRLKQGFSAPLEGSSLKQIIETGEPRILNDLEQYLADHQDSASTRLIVEEGMRSSLTCPLIALGKPIGFMFFSSTDANAYEAVHIETFQRIAGQFATIAEKSRLYEEVISLNEIKNKFLGIAAHDLRNPLLVIKSFVEFFLEGDLGEISNSQRECLNTMMSSCKRMSNLIHDLLDVSAIESGKLRLERKEVDLESHLRGCSAFNSLLAKGKNIELREDFAADLPSVYADPERIGQVINNLISNAIKFSLPDTAITLSAWVESDQVRISVSDQGQGIPPEEMPKLFTDFGKTSIRPTANEPSTGLGLAIARRMVEAHGGEIWAESKVGAGTTFTFTLPLQLDEA